jgi:hypothetical protein
MIMTDRAPTTSAFERLTQEQGEELLERKAKESFGISAAEFRRRWESGELDPDEHPAALELAMLLPLARA